MQSHFGMKRIRYSKTRRRGVIMSCWIILFLLFCNKGNNCHTHVCADTTEDCGCHSHGCANKAEDCGCHNVCDNVIEHCGCNVNNGCIQPRTDKKCECERDNDRNNGCNCNLNRDSDFDCDRRNNEVEYRCERDWKYDRDYSRDRDNGLDCDRNFCRN